MATNDPTPSPDRSVIVEIGPDTTDEELDRLAEDLYQQMSGWLVANDEGSAPG
jgi:hypothetical protein